MRSSIVMITFILVTIFMSFLYLGAHRWETRDMNMLFISAIAEIGAFICFLLYFWTYYGDFKATQIHIVIIEQKTRNAAHRLSLADFMASPSSFDKQSIDQSHHTQLKLAATDFVSAIAALRSLVIRRRSSGKLKSKDKSQ